MSSESPLSFASQVKVLISSEMARRQGVKGTAEWEYLACQENRPSVMKAPHCSISSHSVSLTKITAWTISQCEQRSKALHLPVLLCTEHERPSTPPSRITVLTIQSHTCSVPADALVSCSPQTGAGLRVHKALRGVFSPWTLPCQGLVEWAWFHATLTFRLCGVSLAIGK